MQRTLINNFSALVFGTLFLFTFFSLLFFLPRTVSAATLTVVTATTTSSNASTTLAKIGDTVQFGLQLSGTPVSTSTPVINISNMGTTSMTGAGAWWSYSTTTSASWSQGPLQFKIGHGDSAPGVGATTTRTQANLTGPNVTFDSIAPTLSIVSIASNNSSTTLAKAGDIITVTATSSENVRTPTITIAGQGATFSLITASTTWKGTYTITQSDTEGAAAFSIIYADSAGNSGSDSPKTAVTTGSNVIVDRTAPTISLAGSASDSVYVSNTQSYADPGATVSDSREGTISSALVTTGSVTRGTPGTYTLTYNANDSAGNAATAATRTVTVLHIDSGGIFTGSPSSFSSYKPPRPQIVYPDGRVVYLDEGVKAQQQEGVVTQVTAPSTPGTSGATFSITSTLRRGSQSDEVKTLQKALATDASLYPEGLVTGYFGSLTEKAIQRFQAKYGIVSDGNPQTTGYGLVGPKTRAKLTEVFGR